MKKVYTVFTTEILHNVHIEVIKKAAELGELTVGIYSDNALEQLGRVPIMKQEQRVVVFGALQGVAHVVLQKEISYVKNLNTLKPDIVVRGNNWDNPRGSTLDFMQIRQEIIDTLAQWGGKLVEIPYTQIKTDEIISKISYNSYLPEVRRRKLNYLINSKPIVRIIEAHNGLTGLIAEHTNINVNGEDKNFHGMWVSSLCDSTAKGKPDIELVDHTSRLETIEQIMDITTKPIILDGDSGGQTGHFVHNIKTIERSGVSAIIIEDKIGLKANSLFGIAGGQEQDTIEGFQNKIAEGKKALTSKEFRMIARIESLILKKGLEDALTRAKAYIDAGVDGIMIHSNQKDPTEILAFCDKFAAFKTVPLVTVPTTYNTITEDELAKRGVNIVIYANHLIRAAFPAMQNTAISILKHGRSKEADDMLMSIKDVISLIPK
ncbi:MAG: phosphoenolpyruvate mutase [Defluviitaleaceae bacterium]|nr:phosphoenolpyruvate mutase [Defluviitaleaceae bacterium]